MTNTTPDFETVTKVIGIGLRMLAMRILILLSMCMTFGLFCWSVGTQSWLGFTCAATFAAMVFLPSLFTEARKTGD